MARLDIQGADKPRKKIRISVCDEFLVSIDVVVQRNSYGSTINRKKRDNGNGWLAESRNIQRGMQYIEKQPITTKLA